MRLAGPGRPGRRRGSLRGRLALVGLVVTATWVVFLTVGFNLVLGDRLRAQADDVLRARAAAAASTVEVLPGGRLRIRDPQDDEAIDAGIWIYQGDTAVERAPASPALRRDIDSVASATAAIGAHFAQTPEPNAVRLYAQPLRQGDRQVGTVVAGLGLDAYRRTANLALLASSGLAALLLPGVYLLTRATVARALRPVAAMTRQAAEWSAHDVERRFGSTRRPEELHALADTLDGLLDRLAAVLRHEKQLSAELSHELRTPLTRIVGEVYLLRSRPRSPEELDAAHDAIAAAAEQMSHILETLLAAARSESGSLPGRCEVLPALRRAVATVAAVAPSPGLTMEVRCADTALAAGVEGDILDRILAPLLDNARRHAGSAVVLAAFEGPLGPEIAVTDDGPGVPAGLADAIFTPGRRADPGDGHPGAGLGLALARRLARASGGDLSLRPTAQGAVFVVSLPPA
ncbi:MAG: Histidine kinase [Sphaerisporangium sp.]|nr:Histidine kinase [Sphaerisporangium sp.]